MPAPVLYGVVLDVESYPKFVPWCRAVLVRSRDTESIVADLVAGFKGFKSQYTSLVSFSPPELGKAGWIEARAVSGALFKFLYNRWDFVCVSDSCSQIDFHIEFEFQSGITRRAFEVFYKTVQRDIMAAFRDRALYVFAHNT